ncbi:MAG TPA: hypothetical protein VHA56_12020 [Mucilaginibacter sp.]|nr:hypothetical protein [Mucilaginibacter sp.]
MKELTICYEFNFNVAIKKHTGRKRENYALLATGISYANAVWDLYFTLHKRGSILIRINSVRVTRIAFALDEQQSFVAARLADYPLQLPEDINHDLQYLPQKNER